MSTPPPKSPLPSIGFKKVVKSAGHRIVLYGPGGIGKTTLAMAAPGPIRFVDADESLGRLSGVPDSLMCATVSDWTSLRASLKTDHWNGTKTLVLDSITKIEEWCVEHTLKTVPNEKGKNVASVEAYGYGKGYQHVFETFLHLLSDLDNLCRKGINVMLIAHECVNNVPNPEGEDWIRYEPRLQNPASGKSSIRLRVKEWADHVLFLGYDMIVEDGVGKGGGSRTIYPSEKPHCMAKSRTFQDLIPLGPNTDVWASILK